MSERIGSRDCDSSAPPAGMITFPVSGSVKVPLARPSQKSWGGTPPDHARRVTTRRLVIEPKVASGTKEPVSSARTTAGSRRRRRRCRRSRRGRGERGSLRSAGRRRRRRACGTSRKPCSRRWRAARPRTGSAPDRLSGVVGFWGGWGGCWSGPRAAAPGASVATTRASERVVRSLMSVVSGRPAGGSGRRWGGGEGDPLSASASEVSHASDRFGEQALSGLSQNSSSRTPGRLLRVASSATSSPLSGRGATFRRLRPLLRAASPREARTDTSLESRCASSSPPSRSSLLVSAPTRRSGSRPSARGPS